MALGAPITSKSNARVKALRASFSGNASRPGDRVGLEGEHLLAEALASGMLLDTVYLREGSEDTLQRPALAALRGREICLLSGAAFDSAMHTNSPQGIAATMVLPAAPGLTQPPGSGTFLFLEDVQDPGNFGTLLRSAEAFHALGVFVTPGTVSAWNPKTMRASAGSVFRMPIFVSTLRAFTESMRSSSIKLCAAVVKSTQAVSLQDARLQPSCAILIGNEGAGLSSAALAAASELVNIPCAVESLNAAIAGSIMLYEASRQNARSIGTEAV